jgi:hypothetical protein
MKRFITGMSFARVMLPLTATQLLQFPGMTRPPHEIDPVTGLPNNDAEDPERQRYWHEVFERWLTEPDD